MFRRLSSSSLLASKSLARSFSATPARMGRFTDYVNTIRPNVKEITAAELNARITANPGQGPPASLHILDCRETYEWNDEHIPFAVYTGRGCLERDIEGIIPDVTDDLVVYCAGGVRSLLAADALQKMGYRNVYSLAGGISAWKKAELPIIINYATYSDKIDY